MGYSNILVARSDQQPTMISSLAADLLIALLVLVIFSLLICAALYGLRRYKLKKRNELPMYNDEKLEAKKTHQRRLSGLILSSANLRRQSKPIFVYKEKQEMSERSDSPTSESLPEIHITFPEEIDEAGKRSSGRVYVVRVGEQGAMGLEPLNHDGLPSYQKDSQERFHSLDLERIGGLKEKMPPVPKAQS